MQLKSFVAGARFGLICFKVINRNQWDFITDIIGRLRYLSNINQTAFIW